MPMSGAITRTGGAFARPVGGGDIDSQGVIARAGGWFNRTISGAISSSGALASLKIAIFMVGTVSYQLYVGATYAVQVGGSLVLNAVVTRLGKFRRRVLSKHVLLETGLDLLLEGGGLVYLEGQKVLNFVGTVSRVVGQKAFSLAATMDFAGSLLRWQHIAKSLSGAATPAGALSRVFRVFRFAGSQLSFDATATKKYVAHRLLEAAITLDGAVTYSIGIIARTISAALTLTGSVHKRMFFTLAGTLSFAGSAARKTGLQVARALAGAISSSATVLATRSILKRTVAGVIDPAADILWEFGAKVYGILSFSATVARKVIFYRSESGSADGSGTASNSGIRAVRALAGVINFQGIARRVTDYVKKGLGKFGFNIKDN